MSIKQNAHGHHSISRVLTTVRATAFTGIAVLSLVTACLADSALAQQSTPAAAQDARQDSSTAAGLTEGEVRKVDADNKRITLRHGEIKSLDMPPMTMVFQVKDGALLERVKTGDKVKFRVVKEGSAYVVTEMQPMQ